MIHNVSAGVGVIRAVLAVTLHSLKNLYNQMQGHT